MPSLAAAPIEGRVWINEYLKPARRLVTKYGDVSEIRPERDPRISDADMRRVQIDPLAGIAKGAAGYGYTGRVLGVGPVVLLGDETLNQAMQWQHRTGRPWPYGGVLTTFDASSLMLTIEAANGSWAWRVLPAYWPTMRNPAAWCVGILERGDIPTGPT